MGSLSHRITDYQSPGHVTACPLFLPLYATADIVPLSQIEQLSTALKNLLPTQPSLVFGPFLFSDTVLYIS